MKMIMSKLLTLQLKQTLYLGLKLNILTPEDEENICRWIDKK